MPQTERTPGRVILRFEVWQEVKDKVLEVQRLTGAVSMTEVFIRSVRFYLEVISSRYKTGHKYYVDRGDGNKTEIYFL